MHGHVLVPVCESVCGEKRMMLVHRRLYLTATNSEGKARMTLECKSRNSLPCAFTSRCCSLATGLPGQQTEGPIHRCYNQTVMHARCELGWDF